MVTSETKWLCDTDCSYDKIVIIYKLVKDELYGGL